MNSDLMHTVRQAHRICAAYYQQIFPLIDDAANQLDCSFLQWAPRSYDRPAAKSRNPLLYWAYDFLPGLDMCLVYRSNTQTSPLINTGDFVLDFRLVTDSALTKDVRLSYYPKAEQPDATNLRPDVGSAVSYLCCYLFAVCKENARYDSHFSLWNDYVGYPPTDGEVHYRADHSLKGIGLKVDLNEFNDERNASWLAAQISASLEKLRQADSGTINTRSVDNG